MLIALLAAGCVTTRPERAPAPAAHEQPRVLLMPPQVLALELTTAGLPVPRADWTQHAEAALVEAVRGRLSAVDGTLVRYEPRDAAAIYASTHVPAVKLHDAVLGTILTYHYGGGSRRSALTLTTKGDRLDWTLGDAVAPLREDYDADYALFLSYQQATSSGGRAALTALGFLLYGLIAPTSQSVGIASLVDLHSGRVVWTNVLTGQALEVSRPEGLRDRGRELLSELPL